MRYKSPIHNSGKVVKGMKPLYGNAIEEDLLQNAKAQSVEFTLTHCKDMAEKQSFNYKVRTNAMRYPAICLFTRHFLYVTDRIEERYAVSDASGNTDFSDYDYIDAVPMKILPVITMITTDISQLASLEEFILSLYTQKRSLKVEHPLHKGQYIPFEVTVRQDRKTNREQHDFEGTRYYLSEIYLTSAPCASFTEEYSSARLELDETAKPDIIERLAALENIKELLAKQGDAAEKIGNIDRAWAHFDGLLQDVQGVTAYHVLWKTMQDENCDAKTALEKIRQAQQEEQQRQQEKEEQLQAIRKKYTKKGEAVLNRITDAAVENIKDALKDVRDLHIYGGSTYVDWWREDAEGTLPFPNVLVQAEFNFTFANKTYTNLNGEGAPVSHTYTPDALPSEYGVRIFIQAAEEEQTGEIEELLRSRYADEVLVNIPDPVYEGEVVPIRLAFNSDVSVEKRELNVHGKPFYATVLVFKRFPSVYYPVEYVFSDVRDNHRLQFRLLQQAEFYLLCDAKMQEAIKQLDGDYKDLFTLNQKKSFFGSMLNAVGSVFETQEYKALKAAFKSGAPIDRGIFNKALSKITGVYPHLYDKMMQGVSPEQMHAELQNYASIFNKKWNSICNALAVGACPTMFTQLGMSGMTNQPLEQYRKGLLFYIKKMANDGSCTLADAKNAYDEQLRIEQQEAEEAAAEVQRAMDSWAEARQERRSNGSGVLNTALGVALGNKMSGNSGSEEHIWEAYCPKCGFRGKTVVSKNEPRGSEICKRNRCFSIMSWRRIR